MATPYVGQILAVGFNFAPVGWLSCDGRLLPISQYSILYSLIGTTYGGDGQSTFALPDLRGRGAINQGAAPGGSNFILGTSLGSESVTLANGQEGAHMHPLMASGATGATTMPGTNVALAQNAQTAASMYGPSGANVALSSRAIAPPAGAGQPHENRQPFEVINYIIAYEGIYPSQS